ncbi:glycosyltransferase family 2 protein [Lachnospiraceae bacterium 56-18]
MKEKVSIIVPIYNVDNYLNRCINSLINQEHKNIEILLVDDCSTDKSATIAKKYAEDYPQICYFVQREKNGGLSAARNSGIEVSTGEWIAFVDSDDWVTKDYISAMYEVAKNDNADIVMSSRYQYYPDTEKSIEVCPFSKLTTKSDYKLKVALCFPSATARLFRRSFFADKKIRFPEDIWRCEDISTVVPIFTMTNKISMLQKPTYYYFQRNTSLSNQNHKEVDISFYPKTIERMMELSCDGFEKELEFRAISELMYGMVMIMIRSEREKEEIRRHIEWFSHKFPNWKFNPYLHFLPKGKRLFIYCAEKKYFILLKILIWGWDKMRRAQYNGKNQRNGVV